ncbi:MAG: DUF4389 domain-containing protein [Agarilytica sp.]
MMDEQLKANITRSEFWIRLVYMAFFGVCLQLSRIVLWPVVILQVFLTLFSGDENQNLRKFGSSLSQFVFQICQFLTFNSEEKPFPFSDWPVPEEPVLEGEVEVANESEPVESSAS